MKKFLSVLMLVMLVFGANPFLAVSKAYIWEKPFSIYSYVFIPNDTRCVYSSSGEYLGDYSPSHPNYGTYKREEEKTTSSYGSRVKTSNFSSVYEY